MGGKFAAELSWLWHSHLPGMMRLVLLRQTSGPELSESSAACGLLSLGLVCSGLLPAAKLMSDHWDAESWENLLLEGRMSSKCARNPRLSSEHCRSLLEQLTIATGRSLATIRTDCESVAVVVRDAMAEIQSRRSTQTTVRASV